MTESKDTVTEGWGDPPHPDIIARLLGERHPIQTGEKLRVDVLEKEGRIAAHLSSPRHRWQISVRWQAGGAGQSPWMLMADALDALFGSLIESQRDARALPTGEGVEYQGVHYEVEVQHDVPEATKLADQLLAGKTKR